MTPEDALNRIQNQPQIVVDSSTPPVVQAVAPSVLLLNDPAIRIITSGGTWPGANQMIYTQDADGTLHEYITTSMLSEMIRRGNASASGATPGWTFGATFGEISNVVAHLPNIDYTPVIKLYLQGVALPFAPGLVLQPVINSAINNVGSIYNDQRNSGEHIASSVVTTFAYSIVSVVGLVDLHEAIGGREARSGRDLTSNERWSRGLIGGGTFLLSALPFAQSSRAAPAVAGETAEAAAVRAALEADVRAGLQAVQAERRAAAINRGQRQAMVPERPASPQGQGPVPRPEPVPPRIETPTPAERPVPSEGPAPPVEAPVPPVEAPVPPRVETPVPAERPVPGEGSQLQRRQRPVETPAEPAPFNPADFVGQQAIVAPNLPAGNQFAAIVIDGKVYVGGIISMLGQGQDALVLSSSMDLLRSMQQEKS